MVDVARVNLYGHPIGSVRWDPRYEIAQFEYDPGFVQLGIEPSPLMMPVREGRVYSFGELNKTTFKGLPGMLADSLPDTYGRALFEKWLAAMRLRRFAFLASAVWEPLSSNRPSKPLIRISG